MKTLHRNIVILSTIITAIFVLIGTNITQASTPIAPVNLLSAGNFAVLSKAAITNIPSSIITGDIGASPISGTAIDITCAEVTGNIYAVDAAGPLPCGITDSVLLTAAISDMETAYTNAAGRTIPTATELGAGDISGLTITPGLYKWGTDVIISTDVTLSGGASDVWIFQIDGDLSIASAKKVLLSGGAQAANIFWQVGGPTGATLNTTSVFNGTILSSKQIIMRTGATLNGRALAQTQVVLDQNTVTAPATQIYLLTSVNIASNNASGSFATPGDVVTLSFTGSKSLTGVIATIGGQPTTVTGSTNFWQASRTMSGTDSIGNAPFTIDYEDLNHNVGATITGTTDSSYVYFLKPLPEVAIDYSPATLTGGSVVATISGTGSNPAVTFSGSTTHTFTNNGSYTFDYSDGSGNTDSTGATVTWIDKVAPVSSAKNVTLITQTGATISFNFTEANFASGTGQVLVYTGGTLTNFVETGSLSLSFSGGNGSGIATFENLTGPILYNYIINVTDSVGNISSDTGVFTSASAPLTLTGGTETQTGAVTFTGTTIPAGSTLDLSGTTVNIISDVSDSSYITGSLSIDTNITVTGATAWNGVIAPPKLIDSTSSEAATGSEIGSGITVTETIKVGVDGASLIPATSTGYFTVSFIVPGYSSGTLLGLYRSDDGTTWTRVTPDGSCTLDANLMCTFRTDHLGFFAPVIDNVPTAFSFAAVTGAELGTEYTSVMTVAGINTGSTVTISGGQYKIGNGSYVTSAGTANNGDIITVKLSSSNLYSTATSLTLTVGGIGNAFSVTTKSQPSSGGGGGGASAAVDNCPSGDTSASYYDGVCSPSANVTINTNQNQTVITTTVNGATTTTTFIKPALVISSLSEIKFLDISDNWAKEYIQHLVARGVINNTTRFNPDSNLTRAEFLKIVIRAAGLTIDPAGATPFRDVDANSWYAPYISYALSKNIVTDKNINFRPNDSISRAEAAKIIVGIFGVSVANTNITFSDVDANSDLTRYIETAKTLGFFSGQVANGKLYFRPYDAITRAEIAKVVVLAFKL